MKYRIFAAALAAILLSGGSSFALTMQCAPFQPIQAGPFPSGATYTPDADGIITGVNGNDVDAMMNGGCITTGVGGLTLIARIVGANFNVTTDQTATMLIPAGSYYVPFSMITKDCSTSLTTAKGQVYDAAAKGGNALFGSSVTQAFTSCTGAGTVETIAATASTGGTAGAVVDAVTVPPILSLTTAQGGAATANVYFYGYVLGK
jgi:hypothetical protein